MAGLFIGYNTLSLNEPEEPEYNVIESGMTSDALFSRYIDLSDKCVEMEFDMSDVSCADWLAELSATVAKLHAVASVAFLPTPGLPVFPWGPR